MSQHSDWLHGLNWSREAIASGELWRLVTGHLVHLDLWHLIVNVLGALLLWAVFRGRLTCRDVVWVSAAAVITINTGLWYASNLMNYAGLSGVLHAIATAGIYRSLASRDPWGWPLVLLGVVKLTFELFGSPAMLNETYRVAVEAHLFGVIGGLLFVIISIFVRSTEAQMTRSGDR